MIDFSLRTNQSLPRYALHNSADPSLSIPPPLPNLPQSYIPLKLLFTSSPSSLRGLFWICSKVVLGPHLVGRYITKRHWRAYMQKPPDDLGGEGDVIKMRLSCKTCTRSHARWGGVCGYISGSLYCCVVAWWYHRGLFNRPFVFVWIWGLDCPRRSCYVSASF